MRAARRSRRRPRPGAMIYAFQHVTSGRIRKARHVRRRDAERYIVTMLEPFWSRGDFRLIWVDREERVYGGAAD